MNTTVPSAITGSGRAGRALKMGLATLASALALTACLGPPELPKRVGSTDSFEGLEDLNSDPYDVFENWGVDYYDGCQWAKGCGGSIGAWNGTDSNSISGGTGLSPLG